MRNLRLPEFDKNRNVDQQKAPIFQLETCKYDVILGANLFGKIVTDTKYSTGTMEWFDNELPLCNPHLLQNKEFEAIAEIKKSNKKMNFLAWTSMIQLAMQLRS
jgi:hypothetical protein